MSENQFVTYKELMQFADKMSSEAKNDRHEMAGKLTDFMFKMSDEFNYIKKGLAGLPVLSQKITTIEKDIIRIEADVKENKKVNTEMSKKIWMAGGAIGIIVTGASFAGQIFI